MDGFDFSTMRFLLICSARIEFNGITFHLGVAGTGNQTLDAEGTGDRLAARKLQPAVHPCCSRRGRPDCNVPGWLEFTKLGDENWTGFIGQWDTRQWKPSLATAKVDGKDVVVRTDWRISANHQKWDLNSRENRMSSPGATRLSGHQTWLHQARYARHLVHRALQHSRGT